MKIRVLGCGHSGGVPSLDHGWGLCNPDNPKNKRSRSSILLEKDDFRLLIDAAPELRLQLIDAEYPKIDAVLYSHLHSDHIAGTDDLRALTWENPIPIYIRSAKIEKFISHFQYMFNTPENNKMYVPKLMINPVHEGVRFNVGPFEILPILQQHGPGHSLGFRIGNFSYNTDVADLDEDGFNALKGVKTMILDCVSFNPKTEKHLYVDKAVDWINKIGAERAFFTHMGPKLDYDHLVEILPDHIRPSYDGLEFEVEE